MTLSAPIADRHDYAGNDITESFPYTVKLEEKEFITLIHTSISGAENSLGDPQVDVDYTVNDVGVEGGGTVDFPKAGSSYSTLATGEGLTLLYDYSIEQNLDLQNKGRVFNQSVEDQLDYIVKLINQAQELHNRALKLPKNSTLVDVELPVGASKLFAWNSTATALELLSIVAGVDLSVIAAKGVIAQGNASGNAAALPPGGTGAMLHIVSGLLAYLAVGATNSALQIVAGQPTWVTNPIFLLPTIADLTNMTHGHADDASGGNTLDVPTIADLTNMTHGHVDDASGGDLGIPYIRLVDEKSSGTAGGTFTSGAWRTRDIAEDQDDDDLVSVSSNVITMEAGTYDCFIRCPAADGGSHQSRLYNTSDSALLVLGSNASLASGGNIQNDTIVNGRFTLSEQKTLEIQHRRNISANTFGFGISHGWGVEVYTVAEFWKVR